MTPRCEETALYRDVVALSRKEFLDGLFQSQHRRGVVFGDVRAEFRDARTDRVHLLVQAAHLISEQLIFRFDGTCISQCVPSRAVERASFKTFGRFPQLLWIVPLLLLWQLHVAPENFNSFAVNLLLARSGKGEFESSNSEAERAYLHVGILPLKLF